jgi:hypothetical protein
MIGNAYATQPSRNAAGEQEFQAPCTLAADLPLLNQTGPVLRRGPVVTRGHSPVAFYPGYPADWVRLSSGRTPSDTQADGVEACFGPGSLYAGLPGASTRLKGTADWLPLGTRASSHANPYGGDGHSRARHQPITLSQACDRMLVSAWLKRKVPGGCPTGREISYRFAETSSPVREFRLRYASGRKRIAH